MVKIVLLAYVIEVVPTPCPWMVRFVLAIDEDDVHVAAQLPAGNATVSPFDAAA
jgi:hypothetical protein